MIEYQNIRQEHVKCIYRYFEKYRDNGLSDNNHLYITFLTNHNDVDIPGWLKKYPEEMTIVIQHEYSNIKINKNNFSISMSFNDIFTNLEIGYKAIISFADPSANFGLILKIKKNNKKLKNLENNKTKYDNVINFSNYKKS